ncbi:DEAH-box RNA-dependent ATPase PRP2 Ecym_2113 [Eremothecium cymbalariae DBVPG|uniref:RNA helicase n=1 Tax=Eremothecium cymbalariae (strain CBS 270.75 / DBVPG 7215 / KCTC 17166 / NRRL Y-17582) TaxID=931890 RepID=G8JPL7_ERECY|nr:Hypothetical protein Ecym_2113 [Eremothecium cymbalariae DBVPG\
MGQDSAEQRIIGIGKRRVKRSFEEVEEEVGTSREILSEGGEARLESTDGSAVEKVEGSMDELRRLARQKYLDRREHQKLEWVIHDLEILEEDVKKYGWDNLTEREREEISIKRQVVQLVKDRQEIEEKAQSNFYISGPDGASGVVKEPSAYVGNEVSWEDQQVQKSVKGHNDAEVISVQGGEQYSLVLDSRAMVNFTDIDMITGKHLFNRKSEKLLSRLESNLKKEIEHTQSMKAARKSLPVYSFREELLKAINEHQVLIVVGETGSGKTTQLPQYLVEDGYTKGGRMIVACTQPRRVAATSVATRVADEMNVVLGREVGYQIRFDDKTTKNVTVLKYMTDGMLLREFLTDPELTNYSCIMIDEAHERTLATDILLGLLKDILPHRKDLKLLISSATMNASKFSEFFYNAPIFNIPGRRYPVDIHYTLQPEANYLHATISTILQIHTTQELPGDILVFLTGQDEIENVRDKIEEICFKLGKNITPLMVTPIYANLPQEQQAKIFETTPKGARKVVLATNIAETSLTIDGIKYVVDPGFVKEKTYVPQTGMSQLLTIPCSKASVDQRAGRAGRVGPGKCFRLFTKWSYNHELEDLPKPEILRTNLSQVVLLLLSMGITSLLTFPMLDKPRIPNLSRSLEQLYVLGALNNKGTITKIGRIMCEFPCEPEFGKVIHSSAFNDKCNGVLEEVITIVSMLHETASIFVPGKERKTVLGIMNSDHMLYLEIFDTWANNNYSRSWCKDHNVQYRTMSRVKSIREQLWRCSDKLGLVSMNQLQLQNNPRLFQAQKEQRIIKCFITGFPFNVAQLTSSGYRTLGSGDGISVNIHPTSIIYASNRESGKPHRFLLYQQLVLTSKEFMRDCMPLPQESWLKELVPQFFIK